MSNTTRLHFGTRPGDESQQLAAAAHLTARGYTATLPSPADAGGYCVDTNAPYKTAINVKRAARCGTLTPSEATL